MQRRWQMVVAFVVMGFGVCPVLAQIPYVTVRTPRSPGPPMVLVRSNTAPAVLSQPANVLPAVAYRIPSKPSLDKDELQRRVVAFQMQRAREGSESAQYELGMRYWTGNGVDKDPKAARHWLSLAAAAGHAQAREKLVQLDAALKAVIAENPGPAPAPSPKN